MNNKIYAKVGRGNKAHIVDGTLTYAVLCGAQSNGRGIRFRSGLRQIENPTENQICKSCLKVGA